MVHFSLDQFHYFLKMLPLLTLVASAVVFLCFRMSRRRMYELAAKIQGPPEWPLIGHTLIFAGGTEKIMKAIFDYSMECMNYTITPYISKIWFGPKLIFALGDPRDAEVVLKECMEKDELAQFVCDLTGDGLIFAPVSIWKHRRKMICPAFNKKILDTFVNVFHEQSQILVDVTKQYAGKGKVDMTRALNAFTLDSVSETAMGVQIGSQKSPKATYLQAVEGACSIICMRIFCFWLYPQRIFNLTNLGKMQKKYIDIIFQFTDEVIRKKRKQFEDHPDLMNNIDEDDGTLIRRPFLDLMISLSGKEQAFTDRELREEVLTMVIAGTDTSALGVGYTLLCLGAHPDVQQKAYQEMIEVLGEVNEVTKDDLHKLKYLECVIKESMRLFPPVPLTARKVEKEIVLPSGNTLPAGCAAVINHVCLHRSVKEWGPDAMQFRPERFLEENTRHPCSFIPFSYGARMCLGYQYAMMSMKTVVSNFLRAYKIKSTTPQRFRMEIMMRPSDGIEIEIERRAAAPA